MRNAIIVAACLSIGCGARSELAALGDAAGGGGSSVSTGGSGGGTPGLCPSDMTEPVVLEGRREVGRALALNGDDVYYSADNTILRVPKAGGEPEVVIDGFTGGDIVIDDDTVFFTNVTVAVEGHILRMDLDGGSLELLTSELAPVPRPFEIVVSATHVYWSALFGGGVPIMRVPRTGGATEQVEFPVQDGNPLAIDETHLYWGDGDLIYFSSLTTTDIGILADLQSGHVDALQDDDTYLYAHAGGIAWRVDKRSGNFLQLDTVASAPAGNIAVDGESVYWTNFARTLDDSWGPDEPIVFSLPKDGAMRADVVATSRGVGFELEAHAIAVDDSCVYWAQRLAGPGLAGIVFRMAK